MGINELFEIRQVDDGTWRVDYWPFADKIRNLASRDDAVAAWEQIKPEVLALHAQYVANGDKA